MSRKFLIIALVAVYASSAWAYNADYYINSGRTQMFNGTLSGVRSAYQTFSNGLNDAGCADCAASRELKFLHAVTGTTLLVIRDDGHLVNSFLELGGRFGLTVTGDRWAPYLEPSELQLNAVCNSYGIYEIPPGAPNLNQVRNIVNTSIVPQIDTIVAELDSITDTAGNRFKIFLNPSEFRVFFDPNSSIFDPQSPDYDPQSRFLQPLEVDYGEVLLLKGFLIALKAQLTAQLAYDTYVDQNDLIFEKIYGKSFSVSTDLLDRYPYFLKVLPTIHDSNNGTAILAKAAGDINSAITYYLQAVDYIAKEDTPPGTDPQNNEFLYIDPNDSGLLDSIKDRLTTLQLSLLNDTIGTYPWQTTKKYSLHSPDFTNATWDLVLNYDLVNRFSSGIFTAFDEGYPSSQWVVTDVSIDGSEIIVEMDYEWSGAMFNGTLSSDSSTIINGTFTYWGYGYGTINDMSGSLVNTTVENKQIDFNPLFGSVRYPSPVNPRDLLPQFDGWNSTLPNTMGHGLGNNATLGGILPGVTQNDWWKYLNLQPSGLFYLQEVIYPWQKNSEGFVDTWLSSQLIFDDPAGDTWQSVAGQTHNVDVKRLYMGYDDEYLYGSIILHDFCATCEQQLNYDLYLSYTSANESSLHSIWLHINTTGSETYGDGGINYMMDDYGYSYWQWGGNFEVRRSASGVKFKVPWESMPDRIPGRFISLDTQSSDGWGWNCGEHNPTHKQIQIVGMISGTVTYNNYSGAPIFVQAYTDPRDPDGSTVASTVITEPGPYILDGIGLGWQGYVRAYTPLLGFSIFALDTLKIEDATSIFQYSDDVGGVDLALTAPKLLQAGACDSGYAVLGKPNWYSFDAVAGKKYIIGPSPYFIWPMITLFDRDGATELLSSMDNWDYPQIVWSPAVSGRYYISVATYEFEGSQYEICLTSCSGASTDIASPDGWGIQDCEVDSYDLEVLTWNWLNTCDQYGWCNDADFDHNGTVNLKDFARMAGEW